VAGVLIVPGMFVVSPVTGFDHLGMFGVARLLGCSRFNARGLMNNMMVMMMDFVFHKIL
jgi:hypothetical protein